MHRLYEFILSRSAGTLGRLAAGAIIGAVVSLAAISKEPSLRSSISPATLAMCGGVLGMSAVALLEGVDARRRRRDARGDPRPTASEQLLGCCVIGGMALGLFSVLCAIIMGVVHAIDFVRGR